MTSNCDFDRDDCVVASTPDNIAVSLIEC